MSEPASVKIAPDDWRVVRGSVSVRARFAEGHPDSQARIVFGYDPSDGSYLCAGVGGHRAAYVIDEWKPAPGVLSPIRVAGEPPPTTGPCELELKVEFQGRAIALLVDGAPVITRELPRNPGFRQPKHGEPIGNAGLGLFAWGHETITFSEFEIAPEPSRAVVVMQFSDFEGVYADLISFTLRNAGLHVDRLDEHATPQGILEDIRLTIRDADLVVAEITPENENVFYEVGYAHASGAPTLLVVHEKRELPFDVAPERCIKYGDSDASRKEAVEKLERAVSELGLV